MAVGVRDQISTSTVMEADALWGSRARVRGYGGETFGIAGYNRSYDTYVGAGLTLSGTSGNDALILHTAASTAVDSQGTAVGSAAHFSGVRTFNLNAGNDLLDLSLSSDPQGSPYATAVQANGGSGNDVLITGRGNDALYGEAGNDVLQGGAGGDFLSGNAGNDVLQGGASADLFEGGAGNDVLRGGAGTDSFYFSLFDGVGNDTVRDYADGELLSMFGAVNISGLAGFGQLQPHITQAGADTVIDLSGFTGGGVITLQSFDAALLDAGDFEFN